MLTLREERVKRLTGVRSVGQGGSSLSRRVVSGSAGGVRLILAYPADPIVAHHLDSGAVQLERVYDLQSRLGLRRRGYLVDPRRVPTPVDHVHVLPRAHSQESFQRETGPAPLLLLPHLRPARQIVLRQRDAPPRGWIVGGRVLKGGGRVRQVGNGLSKFRAARGGPLPFLLLPDHGRVGFEIGAGIPGEQARGGGG